MYSPRGLRIGTSAFTASGWLGSFYPKGTKPADFLSVYAQHFDTVEVDSTYYRTPAVSTVKGWAAKTPENFIFAAKVPQTITHEKVLLNCDDEFRIFVETMENLGDKLGPLLIQLPYLNKSVFKSGKEFLDRLAPFLKILPKSRQFALEIRNKAWLGAPLADLLRSHNVALALIDQAWMPRPAEWFAKFDPITADFCYVRLLGDRKGIEALTKIWDKTIVDRKADVQEWVKVCQRVVRKGRKVYLYCNNHYAGHGPATVELFKKLWDENTR